MVSNAELRARARHTLGYNIFENKWLFAVVVCVIASAVMGLATSTIVGILLGGIVTFGVSKYFLYRSRNMIRNDNFEILFDGVKIDFAGNVILGLLTAVFTALWSLLFVIPGIVKAYAYSMAFYIKIDHPEYTASQALEESQKIMRGNKMKLFLLDLSFIGWMIVGALCLGVGTFWVNAYMEAAHAEFYRDIIGDYVIITPAD